MYVLTRNNTITGRLYNKEPAIFGWELGEFFLFFRIALIGGRARAHTAPWESGHVECVGHHGEGECSDSFFLIGRK